MMGKNFWKVFFRFMNLFGFWAKILLGLSKLHSTCQKEHFEEDLKKLWTCKRFAYFDRKISSRAGKTAVFMSRWTISVWKNVKMFTPNWQNKEKKASMLREWFSLRTILQQNIVQQSTAAKTESNEFQRKILYRPQLLLGWVKSPAVQYNAELVDQACWYLANSRNWELNAILLKDALETELSSS